MTTKRVSFRRLVGSAHLKSVWMAIMATVSCSRYVASPGEGAEGSAAAAVGRARIVVSIVPAAALCIELSAVGPGGRRRDQSFSLIPNAAATLEMTGLPIGAVQLTGLARDRACGAGLTSEVPSWVSDTVDIVITPGVVAQAELLMHRNGRASISVDFDPEPACLADGQACDPGAPQACCSPAGCHGGRCGAPSCVPNAGACDGSSPCCTGAPCVHGECDGPACYDDNFPCEPSRPCCSGVACVAGICGGCFSLHSPCDGIHACCSGVTCVNGFCGGPLPCLPDGTICPPSGTCCSGACNPGRACGVATCTVQDDFCKSGSECCAGLTCEYSLCGPPCVPGGVCRGRFPLGPSCPTPPSPSVEIREISAGDFHTCAILGTGQLKCWGANDLGQLGQGDTANRGDEPNEMGGHLAAVDFGPGRIVGHTAGRSTRCAFARDPSVGNSSEFKCWGNNAFGSLGLGDTRNRGVGPGEMGLALPAVQLAHQGAPVTWGVSVNHACVTLFDHFNIQCWGLNSSGQLGLGDTDNRGDQPGEMGDALGTVDLGAAQSSLNMVVGEEHTCSRLVPSQRFVCWGANQYGQLGTGTAAGQGGSRETSGQNLVPVDFGKGFEVAQVVAGRFHNCATFFTPMGAVKCWGRNDSGQLGLGDTIDRGNRPGQMGDALPTLDLGAGRTVQRLSLGGDYTCALLDNFDLKCWGGNAHGQLGLGDRNNRGDEPGEMGDHLPAVDLGAGCKPYAVETGRGHTCVIINQQVKCWGANSFGQLGLGDTTERGGLPGQMGDNLPLVNIAGP